MSQLVTHLRTAIEKGTRIYADVRAEKFSLRDGVIENLIARVIDRRQNRPSRISVKVKAKAFVVAAGAYNSAALLMRNGLSGRLPHLGKGFAFNPSPMVHGRYNEEIILWRNIPAAFGVDHFRLARYGAMGEYVEGGYMLMPNQLQPATLAATIPLIGDELENWMKDLPRIGSTIGWIDDHPDELGEIRINENGETKIHYPFGPTTSSMLRDLIRKQVQLQFACGAHEVVVSGSQAMRFRRGDLLDPISKLYIRAGGLHMGAPHPSGGCRMGRSEMNSVVDSSHRVHGFRNLFVADSSVFPTSASVDPSFTIMAFSYVAAANVAAELGA